MRTLLISDVHERYDKLLRIEEDHFHKADRVVMLGDFFDTYNPKGKVGLIVTWLKGKLYDPKFTICWGNHDAHYAFQSKEFRCSGYNPTTQKLLAKEMSPDDWKQFKPFTTVGPFLVSHAGFCPDTIHLKDKADEALKAAFAGLHHEFWGAGYARGGMQAVGGPVWLDWNFEFEPLPDQPQIVGHTVQTKGVAIKQGSYCIDTGNRHVLWVDESTGKVTIDEV